MKVSNLIKALEKAGCKVEVIKHKSVQQLRDGDTYSDRFDIWHYLCENSTRQCDATRKCDWFSDSFGEVRAVYVLDINQHDDIRSDYFPGTFCDTIKQTIKYMTT